MQLVAYGAQDIYLTGNPQITFFKVVYRRHTNFSMESIRQTFDGNADFGGNVTATISRNGDLVHRMYLEHNATFTSAQQSSNDQLGLVEHYGHSLIRDCEIEIGGQRIDRHTSMWNRVYSDLTEFNPSGHFGGSVPDISSAGVTDNGTLYQLMSGNGFGLNTSVYQSGDSEFAGAPGDDTNTVNGFSYTNAGFATTAAINTGTIFIPLNFWFNRNPGLALPLIALQYHEVKIKINFETLANLGRHSGPTNPADDFRDTIQMVAGTGTDQVNVTSTFNLYCDYIYLDTDERRRFAQVSHEYLIEQLQISNNEINNANPNIELNFNHPVKELIWTMRNESSGLNAGRCQTFVNTGNGDPTVSPVTIESFGGEWLLKLNGHDRFKRRDTKYFTRTQVHQHHTGYGGIPTINDVSVLRRANTGVVVGMDSIAVYSFSLKPEEHQPSGTCNFSRIDNARLRGINLTTVVGDNSAIPDEVIGSDSTTNSIRLTIFAVNYNVLRIMSGMGGLAYSN